MSVSLQDISREMVLMNRADLNPYRSSEVLAEAPVEVALEPVRPSFQLFRIGGPYRSS